MNQSGFFCSFIIELGSNLGLIPSSGEAEHAFFAYFKDFLRQSKVLVYSFGQSTKGGSVFRGKLEG